MFNTAILASKSNFTAPGDWLNNIAYDKPINAIFNNGIQCQFNLEIEFQYRILPQSACHTRDTFLANHRINKNGH